jgi:hypothetical protein
VNFLGDLLRITRTILRMKICVNSIFRPVCLPSLELEEARTHQILEYGLHIRLEYGLHIRFNFQERT